MRTRFGRRPDDAVRWDGGSAQESAGDRRDGHDPSVLQSPDDRRAGTSALYGVALRLAARAVQPNSADAPGVGSCSRAIGTSSHATYRCPRSKCGDLAADCGGSTDGETESSIKNTIYVSREVTVTPLDQVR